MQLSATNDKKEPTAGMRERIKIKRVKKNGKIYEYKTIEQYPFIGERLANQIKLESLKENIITDRESGMTLDQLKDKYSFTHYYLRKALGITTKAKSPLTLKTDENYCSCKHSCAIHGIYSNQIKNELAENDKEPDDTPADTPENGRSSGELRSVVL